MLLFPLVNGLENFYQDTEISMRIASRVGVDSFPTYLHKGISRPPTLRISDNYNEMICAFLYAPYSYIGFQLAEISREAENCIIE